MIRGLITILFILGAGILEMQAASYGGGSGSISDPFLIAKPAHMKAIGANSQDWRSHFRLQNDIDLKAYTGRMFNIIGTEDKPFSGTFDGNHKKILNFRYREKSEDNIAIFGVIDGPNANISDLTMIDPLIEAEDSDFVAPLVGQLRDGKIFNCLVDGGLVHGDDRTAGLVGRNQGEIERCVSSCRVMGDKRVGGLVGSHEADRIFECGAHGDVSGETRIGGLVGLNEARIETAYAWGSATGTDTRVGGLVGHNESSARIIDCYAIGFARGSERVGGLAGLVEKTDDPGDLDRVKQCYSVGAVYGPAQISTVGGLVGESDDADLTIRHSFWDKEASGQIDSAGGTSVWTSTAMHRKSTYTTAVGLWKFVDETDTNPQGIWMMPAVGGPPIHQWMSDPNTPGHKFHPESPDWWFTRYGGGTGTSDLPIQITSVEDFLLFGNNPQDWGHHFQLTIDLDLSRIDSTDYNIIGTLHNEFNGIFDGQGHAIAKFTYEEQWNDTSCGLFGTVAGATIKNLTLINPRVTSSTTTVPTGALAGSAKTATFENCTVTGGIISGHHITGGLVGVLNESWIPNSIIECRTSCKVRGAGILGGLIGQAVQTEILRSHTDGVLEIAKNSDHIGGLVGAATRVTVNECYTSGNISTEMNCDRVGGLIGFASECDIVQCNSYGDVLVNRTDSSHIGGLIGYCEISSVGYSASTGKVIGGEYLGGLIGATSDSAITRCESSSRILGVSSGQGYGGLIGVLESGNLNFSSATGAVSDSKKGIDIGGLVGRIDSGRIAKCFARGVVTGQENVGGLVGTSTGAISKCYATGKVTGSRAIGGLVGTDPNEAAENSFWNIETSGLASSAGGVGLASTTMKQMATYAEAGWDFETPIWTIEEGSGYPLLSIEVEIPGDFVEPFGVDILDLMHVCRFWLSDECGFPSYCGGTDIDRSGDVDLNDWLILQQNWLTGIK